MKKELSQFPDGPAEMSTQEIAELKTKLDSAVDSFLHFSDGPAEMSTQEIAELKTKLDSAVDSEEISKLILHTMDNYSLSPDLNEVLLEHKEILKELKRATFQGLRATFQELKELREANNR